MYDFHQTALCWGNLHWLQALRDSETNRESAGLSHFSRVQLCVTLWTIARQASLSMGFSRQEYCSGLSRPSPRAVPNSGTEPATLYVFCIGKQVLYHQSQKTSRGKTWLNGQLG